MSEKMESMNKKREFTQLIIHRIREAMRKQNLTQADVLEIASKRGFSLKQSALSKMLSEHSSNLSLTGIVEISNVLGLDLNELFSLNPDTEVTIPEETNHRKHSLLVRRADDPQMRGYLNTYYAYFFPTKSSEDKLLKGNLKLYPSKDNSKCLAMFSFKTGKFDEKKQPIIKKYEGELVLSVTMNAAYCSLINEEIGEISYVLFQYMPILFEKLRCRVALVLTSSSGDHRRPTAHRMILSTDELSKEDLQILQGQLYLNESEILISEIGLEKFLEDDRLDKSFKEYFCRESQSTRFAGLSPMPYYRFDESIIRDSFLNTNVKINAINLIRQYAVSPKYNKVGSKCNDLVFKYISGITQETTNDSGLEEN